MVVTSLQGGTAQGDEMKISSRPKRDQALRWNACTRPEILHAPRRPQRLLYRVGSCEVYRTQTHATAGGAPQLSDIAFTV